jgi:hypothetical protein
LGLAFLTDHLLHPFDGRALAGWVAIPGYANETCPESGG